MAATDGIIGLVTVLVLIGGGYWLIKSGVLQNIGGAATAPVQVPAAGGTTIPATGTTPAGTTPATTGDPIQDLLNGIFGNANAPAPSTTGGINAIPMQGGVFIPTGAGGTQTGGIYGGNPQLCQSQFNGNCNSECANPANPQCQQCQMACGGAQIGAIQTLPPQGGTNAQLCSSKYHGKCNTECENPNSSDCISCKQACGSFYGTYSYYTQAPQSLMASSVWRNANYSRESTWNIDIANAK